MQTPRKHATNQTTMPIKTKTTNIKHSNTNKHPAIPNKMESNQTNTNQKATSNNQ